MEFDKKLIKIDASYWDEIANKYGADKVQTLVGDRPRIALQELRKNLDYWDEKAPKGATHYYPAEKLWLQCSESGGWFSHWFQNGWRKMSFAVWLDIKRDVIKKPSEKHSYDQHSAQKSIKFRRWMVGEGCMGGMLKLKGW